MSSSFFGRARAESRTLFLFVFASLPLKPGRNAESWSPNLALVILLRSVTIIDQDSNKRLVTFRTYKTADGYMRNYIEKGDLWKELTNIANVKESVREGAVPDNSKVKLLRELLSKPLMSGDLKAQMNAYVAIPDPSMIKDFRAARAMAGDEHDLRDVLRSYAKVKLHPDVLRKIK